jgi:hypothetical protein
MEKQKPIVLVVQNVRHVLTVEPAKPAKEKANGQSDTR